MFLMWYDTNHALRKALGCPCIQSIPWESTSFPLYINFNMVYLLCVSDNSRESFPKGEVRLKLFSVNEYTANAKIHLWGVISKEIIIVTVALGNVERFTILNLQHEM